MKNMAVPRLAEVIEHLRRSGFAEEASVSDGQLLDHFLDCHDEYAFAALVRRHGPMVWGVCRRIVAHHQDAEDAFQATFLVLARKATSIRPRTMVANWLFGVAHRTALKAKTMAGKRQAREKQVANLPELASVERSEWESVESLIDQELANLPDKYRIAVVLCDLEGKKGKDVARQLKIPEGTLASRLRTGRQALAKRLVRHGITLSVGALATALAQNAASAAAPIALVSSTIKAATLIVAGKTVAAGLVSANATALMEGVMKVMLMTKLKTALAAMVVVGLIAFGGGAAFHHAAVGQPGPSANAPATPKAEEKQVQVDHPPPFRPANESPESKHQKASVVTYPIADLILIPDIDDLSDANGIFALEESNGTNSFEAALKRHIKYKAETGRLLKGESREAWLMDKIARTVSPSTWETSGGPGRIQYFPLDHKLVVKNTPGVQSQVRHLLEVMQQVQKVQVSVAVRTVSLDAASMLEVRKVLPKSEKESYAVLSDAEMTVLRKALDDAKTEVTFCPKITFSPGQWAKISVTDSINERPGFEGVKVWLKAMISADLRYVELDVLGMVAKREMPGKVTKAQFVKAMRLEDGATLAQVERYGDGYLMLLVTPTVVIEREAAVSSPAAEQAPR